ncbi:MAG: hypothetical protein Tsb0034_17590 [Ekhidna sp.]
MINFEKMIKMKLKITQLMALAFLVMMGAPSCKNKQKVAEMSDPDEVKAQIEEEEKMNEEEEEEVTPERNVVKSPSSEEKLTNYFKAISASTSTASANSSISEALTMFSSKDIPVLIVFYEANGTPSYDEPTTIDKYLNYLKDTKNFNTRIDEMVMDSNGKIKELVLKKK